MKQLSNELLNDLIAQCNDILEDVYKLQNMPTEKLHQRPNSKSWNILECIEHMNLYGEYYLPEIEKSIKNSKHIAAEYFISRGFGNFSAKSMLPKKSGYTNWPMKTFPQMDPFGTAIKNDSIERFIEQMKQLVVLLEKSKTVNLKKNRCTLTIKWLKFSLGDTLRFMIYHNYRHMLQVKKILNNLS